MKLLRMFCTGARHVKSGTDERLRITVHGGAVAARADALGGQCHAPAPTAQNGTMARVSTRAKAAAQHEALADLVAASGAEIEWLDDDDDGLADSVFTHDPSLMTDHGALILSMGKPLRASGAGAARATYNTPGHSHPRPRSRRRARSKAATASGSMHSTLAIGRGVRTNQAGIQQMANLLGAASASRSSASTCRSGRARRPACI